MNAKDEALKMAIEALEISDRALNEFFEGLAKLGVPKSILKLDTPTNLIPAINACKEALEQPAQDTETMAVAIALQEQIRQLKEQPAQKPLSDNEVERLWKEFEKELAGKDIRDFTRAIEQAHGIV